MAKVKAGPVNADRLKSFLERIEKLVEEQKAIGGDIRDVFSEAKGVGYDVKTMRTILRLRAMDAADRAEQEALLDTYCDALGMATSPNIVHVRPSEDELEERAERIVREIDRCMALVVDGKLPKIAAIQELVGCSTGKAHKLRGFVAERISRSKPIHRENPTPPYDPATGEITEKEGATDTAPDATPAGAVVVETSGVTAGETADIHDLAERILSLPTEQAHAAVTVVKALTDDEAVAAMLESKRQFDEAKQAKGLAT